MQTTHDDTPDAVPYQETPHRAFWAAARQGHLLLRRCTQCHEPHWYPRVQCPYCLGETAWEKTTGHGSIYALAIDRTSQPHVAVAYVRLAEGVTLLTNILTPTPDDLRIDDPVEVQFLPGPDGTLLPFFRPMPVEA